MSSTSEVWKQLRNVVALRFKSKSNSGTGWSGFGAGIVEVMAPTPDVLIFHESGLWHQEGGKELRFTNVFRWSRLEEHLRLEHLRFGANKPVFLFDMAVDINGTWHEIVPHPCRDDCYRASIHIEYEQVFVNWLVRGPKRNEVIDYTYT